MRRCRQQTKKKSRFVLFGCKIFSAFGMHRVVCFVSERRLHAQEPSAASSAHVSAAHAANARQLPVQSQNALVVFGVPHELLKRKKHSLL
jgi:hypothetical protein